MATLDTSLQLRVGAVFIMFSASLLGVVLPLHYSGGNKLQDEQSHRKMAESENFRILRTFAAGIMLGVGFIHLLNDGVNKLVSVCLEYPSLAFTLATVGVLIVLGFEQVAVMLISRVKVHDSENRIVHKKSTNTMNSVQDCAHAAEELEVISSHAGADHSNHYCDHNHAIQMIAGTNSLSVIVKAYMMEISVAIHSIIIGITLGSLAGPENLPSLRALVVAISFHQFFEGLGLGTVIEAARLHLGLMKIIIFALTFAATVPIGILIGILITQDRLEGDGPTDTELYVTGSLNSIAAGILIYVALVEMIAEDFQHAAIARKEWLKIQMFLALMTGTLFMAVLAIWA